jgi:hypothetical protein
VRSLLSCLHSHILDSACLLPIDSQQSLSLQEDANQRNICIGSIVKCHTQLGTAGNTDQDL